MEKIGAGLAFHLGGAVGGFCIRAAAVQMWAENGGTFNGRKIALVKVCRGASDGRRIQRLPMSARV